MTVPLASYWRDLINAVSRSAALNPAEVSANQQNFAQGDSAAAAADSRAFGPFHARCGTACHAEGRGFESLQPLSQRARLDGVFLLMDGSERADGSFLSPGSGSAARITAATCSAPRNERRGRSLFGAADLSAGTSPVRTPRLRAPRSMRSAASSALRIDPLLTASKRNRARGPSPRRTPPSRSAFA
jgi:hypothetical protein